LRLNENDLRNLIRRSLLESYRKNGLLTESKFKFVLNVFEEGVGPGVRSAAKIVDDLAEVTQPLAGGVSRTMSGLANEVTTMGPDALVTALRGKGYTQEAAEVIARGVSGAGEVAGDAVSWWARTGGAIRGGIGWIFSNKLKSTGVIAGLLAAYGTIEGVDAWITGRADPNCGSACKLRAATSDDFARIVGGAMNDIGSDPSISGRNYQLSRGQEKPGWTTALNEAADGGWWDLDEMSESELAAIATILEECETCSLYGLSMASTDYDNSNLISSWNRTLSEKIEGDTSAAQNDLMRSIVSKINSLPLFYMNYTDINGESKVNQAVWQWGEQWASNTAAVMASAYDFESINTEEGQVSFPEDSEEGLAGAVGGTVRTTTGGTLSGLAEVLGMAPSSPSGTVADKVRLDISRNAHPCNQGNEAATNAAAALGLTCDNRNTRASPSFARFKSGVVGGIQGQNIPTVDFAIDKLQTAVGLPNNENIFDLLIKFYNDYSIGRA